jgi:MSHA biogenesis protein MshJ
MSIRHRLRERMQPLALRMKTLAERIDRLSLRERALLFAGVNVLICIAWQSLLMDPLNARAQRAALRINELGGHAEHLAPGATSIDNDPALMAVARERSLREHRAGLEQELATVSRGYVPPEQMIELLQQLLDRQNGLRLVSMRNLPVESLSPNKDPGTAADHGPFLHPVEMELEGDYASVIAYLQVLERLPWRLHWRQLDLRTEKYPLNRIRIEIGTLSLSRNWMSV